MTTDDGLETPDFSAVYRALPDPHLMLQPVADRSGRIVDFQVVAANDAASAFHGGTDRLPGMRLARLPFADALQGLMAELRAVAVSGTPLFLEDYSVPNVRGDLRVRFFDIRASLVGSLVCCSWRDTTDRHEAMRSLAARDVELSRTVSRLNAARVEVAVARRRAEITRMSMDSAAIGMSITMPDGRFAYVNPALCEMLGYSAQELQSMTFRAITHPDDAEESLDKLHDMRSGLIDSFSTRKRYLTRTGEPIWIDLWVNAVRDDDGSLLHFIAQMVNVTAEVYNFQAQARHAERFRELASSATDVVLEVDQHGSIRWIGPSLGPLLGWEPGLLIGTPLTSLIDTSDPESLRWARSPAASRERDTVVVRTASDGTRTMSARATPLPDEPQGAVVGLRDVTDQLAAADRLRSLERLVRTVIDTGPWPVAVTDGRGAVMHASRVLLDLVGGSGEPGGPLSWSDLLPEQPEVLPRGTRATVHLGPDRTPFIHQMSVHHDLEGRPEFLIHRFEPFDPAAP